MVHGTWYMGAAVGRGRTKTTSKSQKLPKRIGCRSARMRHGPRRRRPVPASRGGQRADNRGQRAAGRGQITEASRRTRRKWKRLGLGGATGGMRVSEGEATRERGASHGPAPKALSVSQRLSAPPSVFVGLAQHVPACASVCQRVPACASVCQHEPAGPSSECRRFRREPVCASSPRPRITAAGLAKSQAKGQESRHSPKSRPLRAGCNKSLASPEAARPAYNMLRCLRSPLPLPLLLSSPSPSSSPAEVA
jgi:hypothetical protein